MADETFHIATIPKDATITQSGQSLEVVYADGTLEQIDLSEWPSKIIRTAVKISADFKITVAVTPN